LNKHLLSVGLLLAVPGGSWAQETVYHDPGMKTVIQVAMVCKDVEATSKAWAKMLGVDPPRINTTRPGHEVKVEYRGKASEGRAKLAFLKMGQVVLEFIQPVGEGTSWKEYLDKHGEGVQHLGFQVADLDKTIQSLGRLGMPVLHRGRYDADNGTYVYMESEKPLGVTVELLKSDPPKK